MMNRTAEHRARVAQYVRSKIDILKITKDDFSAGTTESFKQKFPKYEYILMIDLTEIKSKQPGDQVQAGEAFSHAKKQHAVSIIVLRFQNGKPAFVGDLIVGGAATGFTDTDEIAWTANILTEVSQILPF